uniref:CP-type G domain-containing protein n=1 Tax=Panagrolaimus sp. ES5 TaxID=591445 RepID=A0AC34FX04_9BILA
MANYKLKKPSKRQSCKKKYKIVKKVAEHNKKLKRDTKRKGHHKGAEKLISIPNKCPFKDELQEEAEQRRDQLKAEKALKKAELKAFKADPTKKRQLNTDVQIEIGKKALVDLPAIHHDQYILEPQEVIGDKNDKSTRVFAGEVRKTVEAADIVIEVLDARDPLGSRNRAIEKSVISQGKRLILLLNKIDLVPKANITAWLKYLRLELPTVAFKASTQEQSDKLGRFNASHLLKQNQGSKCIGAELIMSLLANYCRNKDIKTSVRVGVIGYPNVGKSSVINSLKRRRACQTGATPGVTRKLQEVELDKHIPCQTGATPGVTRKLQEVELDKHIRLIDSPGVVLASRESFDPVEIALKNALRVEALADPISPVIAILRRCTVDTLMMHFNIPQFSDIDQFLALIANKIGRLKKGGRPDRNAAARHVLNAWTSGKLRYYTEPPEVRARVEDEAVCSSELLSSFSKEFNLNEIDDSAIVEGLPENVMQIDTAYDPSVPREGDMNGDIAMEEDIQDKSVVVTGRVNAKKTGKADDSNSKISLPNSFNIDGNVQLNRTIAEAIKKNKKKAKKTAKRADKLGEDFEKAFAGNGDVDMEYDFDELKSEV